MNLRAISTGVLVLSSCAALAACSSSSQASSSSSSAASASPTVSIAQAAQTYLGITAQASADLASFLTLPDATPVAQVQAAATAVNKDEVKLDTDLKAQSWPATVQPEVTTLESELAKEAPVYQQAAAAPSVTAIKAVLTQNQSEIASRATAANQLKVALGIPTPSTAASGSATAAASSTPSSAAPSS